MNKSNYWITLLFLLGVFNATPTDAQVDGDTTRVLKNTIRFNLSSPLLFGARYNVIGYERAIREHQTLSANIGRFSLPKFINTDSINESFDINAGSKDKGLNIALDYRFYLQKENKYPAPRGVYIGPYYTFNFFQRENTWTMTTPNANDHFNTTTKLNINMIGAQLGYQFVIRRRLTIDLVLAGPGVWLYNLRTKISKTLDPDDEALVFEKINDLLAAKLPGHEILIKPGEFQKSGSFRTSSFGYRYVVHIGFRF